MIFLIIAICLVLNCMFAILCPEKKKIWVGIFLALTIANLCAPPHNLWVDLFAGIPVIAWAILWFKVSKEN